MPIQMTFQHFDNTNKYIGHKSKIQHSLINFGNERSIAMQTFTWNGTNYTERQKKIITSSELRHSPKSIASKIIIFGHR